MSNDDKTDTTGTLPESQRIKPRTKMQRAKSYAKGWAMAAIATTAAVAIGTANGVPMENVGLFALGACLLDEPLLWWYWAAHTNAAKKQQKALEDEDFDMAKKYHTAHSFITVGLLLFSLTIWTPLRWGAVFAMAMGWL